MRAIVVLRREDAAVGSDFSALERFLFHDNAESIAWPRIGVEIQVPAEYLRQTHGQFWPLSGVQHGIEERAVHLADDAHFLGFRRDGLQFGVKIIPLRPYVKDAIGVNAVTHLANVAQSRAAHHETVARAQMAQIENRLRG